MERSALCRRRRPRSLFSSLCHLGFLVTTSTRVRLGLAWLCFATRGPAQSCFGLAVLICGLATSGTIAAASATDALEPPSGTTETSAIPTWEAPVDTVDVQAGRPDWDEWMRRGSAFASVVPLGDASSLHDLGELLDQSVGVHVHRYGGLGTFSSASVRGSSPGQVSVVLDGFSLGTGANAVVDLSLLPVGQLERAEIYRGVLTSGVGGAPAAATVALTSSSARPAPAQLEVGVGSFGTHTVNGSWGGSAGPWRVFGTVGHRTSDGDFRYLDSNGTPHNPEDDQTVSRRNNHFVDLGGFARATYAPRQALRLDYTVAHFDRKSGVPGTESHQATRVSYEQNQLRQQVTAVWKPRYPMGAVSWGRPRLELSYRDATSSDLFDNRYGEAGVGRAHFDNSLDLRGGSVSLRLPVVPLRQVFDLQWQVDEESFSPDDLLRDAQGFTRRRRSQSITLADRVHAWGGRVTLEAEHRWLRTRDNYGGPIIFGQEPSAAPSRRFRNDSFAVGARLEVADGLALKGTRGRFLRMPTFAELFGENGLQDGNPELKPEAGLQWDAGVSVLPSLGRRVTLEWTTAYFESTVDDKIILLQNSQRTSKAFNLDRTWVRGVESELHVGTRLPGRQELSFQGQVVWQEARDVGPSRTYRGKRLPNLPETESYFETSWRHGDWSVRHGVATRTAAYRDRYNTERKETEGYTLHDVGIERRFFEDRVRWRVEMQNASDKRVQDIDGFPLPGRSLIFETIWTVR